MHTSYRAVPVKHRAVGVGYGSPNAALAVEAGQGGVAGVLR